MRSCWQSLLPHILLAETGKEGEPKNIQETLKTSKESVRQAVLLAVTVALAYAMSNISRPDAQEISFQHFKTQLLSKDVVDKIEIANKHTAKVRAGSQACAGRLI